MREIKFRAWDNDCEKMFFDITFENIINQAIEYNTHWFLETNYILMQYTGLKDKNNKEIYENDIIKSTKYDSNTGIRKDFIWEIIFEDGAFLRDTGGIWEIIGNRYENPELFEEIEEW